MEGLDGEETFRRRRRVGRTYRSLLDEYKLHYLGIERFIRR